MKIDCLAREPHHQLHAHAIFDKLPQDVKGVFCQSEQELAESKNEVVLASAYGDLRIIERLGKKAVFTEHGVGLFYNTEHPSYVGSTASRDAVILRLVPNERAAARSREVMNCPVEVIGVPKMDRFANRPVKMNRRYSTVVAVSFHFDAVVCPETRSAWRHYMGNLGMLSAKYKVLGHAHPRIFKKLAPIYARMGIKPVEDFSEVLKKADIYAVDNSSTLFEFAFTGKPVIVLNCPYYRKWVEHSGNPRFWKYADIGYNVEKQTGIREAVDWTLEHWRENAVRQREIVEDMFTFTDGRAAERAVNAILHHVFGRPKVEIPNNKIIIGS